MNMTSFDCRIFGRQSIFYFRKVYDNLLHGNCWDKLENTAANNTGENFQIYIARLFLQICPVKHFLKYNLEGIETTFIKQAADVSHKAVANTLNNNLDSKKNERLDYYTELSKIKM